MIWDNPFMTFLKGCKKFLEKGGPRQQRKPSESTSHENPEEKEAAKDNNPSSSNP